MAQAYIIDAVRTPVGRRNGGLAKIHPADLAAHPLRELFSRNGIDPAAVDSVILGCLDQIGPRAMDIARTGWLAAGLPESVPATTIDRQCGSSQQAVTFAAQAVMSGTEDLVVAGGVQCMSAIPMMYANTQAARPLGFDDPFTGSTGWHARYGDAPVSQFHGAELMAQKWGLSRGAMEEFAITSHQRALAARAAGRFDAEIAPLAGVTADEGPRIPDRAKIALLAPITPGGQITAAMASQISDGAAALLIASEAAVRQHRLTPMARIHHVSARGDDPIMMLSAPIAATAHALARTGMSLDDIDLIEINEAFAPVVLAWQAETGADLSKVNVNGGAIALGHPLGATGARLMTTLVHEMRRRGSRFGLQTMCEAGGQANVTILELFWRDADPAVRPGPGEASCSDLGDRTLSIHQRFLADLPPDGGDRAVPAQSSKPSRASSPPPNQPARKATPAAPVNRRAACGAANDPHSTAITTTAAPANRIRAGAGSARVAAQTATHP